MFCLVQGSGFGERRDGRVWLPLQPHHSEGSVLQDGQGRRSSLKQEVQDFFQPPILSGSCWKCFISESIRETNLTLFHFKQRLYEQFDFTFSTADLHPSLRKFYVQSVPDITSSSLYSLSHFYFCSLHFLTWGSMSKVKFCRSSPLLSLGQRLLSWEFLNLMCQILPLFALNTAFNRSCALKKDPDASCRWVLGGGC